MRKFVFLILLPFLLISIKSKGQDSLIISPYSVVVGNDSVLNGTFDSVSFYVVNVATTPFSDTVSLYTSVRDSVSAFIYYPIDTVTFTAINIAPNDSAQFKLYYTYTVAPFKFHYDINVIVIWPLTSSATILDSLYYLEWIDTLALGVDEIDLSKFIKAYPNPTTSKLTLENTSQKAIEEVRIYDATGRLIQTEKNPSFICTDEWKAGTYMIKIRLENKQTRTIRVVKQ